ncbi:thioesterase II family protein [Streptomyces zagrosensis]|uniref:Surfactin synthase thioesterase subunit n=1 Tax=Streptomyces zagrosensis TaxID=1042984 RepID=A0A7W9QCR3_9ACTN|nr:alpha/beta fold hydrolase [Streptomyces zagrosensis]MBB5937716.1 surfactin synthase thioesterase subunit [Streptomyces zagrosensis]
MGTANDFGHWIRKLSSVEAPRANLVCFPHAGGSANFYVQFARRFGDLDVHGVQYPGRQDRRREPFRDSIEELAAETAELLSEWGADDANTQVPIVLLGNSMGALVAFEVAHRLEAAGSAPLALFACGRVAPTLLKDQSTHLKSDDAFLREMALLGGLGSELLQDEEIRDLVLPPMRADYRLAETYSCAPEMQLTAPIQVHIGNADPKVNEAEATLWKQSTTGDFTMTTHDGGHFFFTDNGDRLIDAVNSCVHDALAAKSVNMP